MIQNDKLISFSLYNTLTSLSYSILLPFFPFHIHHFKENCVASQINTIAFTNHVYIKLSMKVMDAQVGGVNCATKIKAQIKPTQDLYWFGLPDLRGNHVGLTKRSS